MTAHGNQIQLSAKYDIFHFLNFVDNDKGYWNCQIIFFSFLKDTFIRLFLTNNITIYSLFSSPNLILPSGFNFDRYYLQEVM